VKSFLVLEQTEVVAVGSDAEVRQMFEFPGREGNVSETKVGEATYPSAR
jgi:hypothetical protein